ncbi:STM4015 family protein [Undibacterium sp. TS12]|uniref:STM4015 family protein n=1 Tax=Undibacterium sp. TS12 TaxID=2908202 RepID=UPI001F4C7E7E|nr:STM4015 family protein [Undibacterium sp. TS12]MCH8621208.1 STM4015 family protein [Undibacterium sp. TS12]
MKHYFEYQDSKSYKFWQVEIEANALTVKYGKIGTAGQEKISSFDTEEKAQKEMAKLISEKNKKGYVEKADASAKKIARRLGVSYDEAEEGKTLAEKMAAFLDSTQATEVESLVIAAWEEPYEGGPQEALDLMIAQSGKLTSLKELFVGDMDSEECEISWIKQADYTNLLTAFPALERLHIKGSSDLVLSSQVLKHANLKALTIECGGLPKAVIETITTAHLPELEYLQLYLGVDDYGFDAKLADLRPFMQKGLFPKLKYLGLTDSEIANEIATEIAQAPILEQLETLDLSMGTLSDDGGRALLASPVIKGQSGGLKKLDLHYHYLSNELMKEFKKLPVLVDVSDQQDIDDEWRYPAVTE